MAEEKNTTQAKELIIQTPHIVRLAQGIDVSDAPQKAGEIERDAFVHLARWINGIIHVKVSPDALRATVGNIPGLATAFSAYDLICDIVDLGSYDDANRAWGYQLLPNWVGTTIDVVGLAPIGGQPIKGMKPVLKAVLDPKFQLHHIRDHLAAIGQGAALEWFEQLVESDMPNWDKSINKELVVKVNGLQGQMNQFAQRPEVKLANTIFGRFGLTPTERVNGVLNDIKKHGPDFIRYVMKGKDNFPGIIALSKRVLTKGRSHGAMPGNQKPRPAPKGESETKAVPRNATTGETNTSHRPQTEQFASRHPSVAGKQQQRAPQDCGCQGTAPGGKSAKSARPVHYATGEEILYHTDFTAPGLIPVDFTRCYRSSHAPYDDSLLGARWTSPYTTSISRQGDGLVYHDFMGRNIPLPDVAIGQEHDEAFESFTLRRLSPHTLALVYRNGDVDLFQSEGATQYGHGGKPPSRYFLREKQTKAGPILFILPVREAQARFRQHPWAALLSPEALLVITDGHALWLQCLPASPDSLVATSPAARRAASDLAPVYEADRQAGLALIGGNGTHDDACRLQVVRRIGAIEQILADGTRHTHARYRYAPACGAQGALLPVGAGLDLVEHADALGQARHYAYASHLLTRYTDRHGFGQNLTWDGTTPQARCLRTVADDGTEDTRFTYRPERFETEVRDADGTVRVYAYNGQHLICGVETRHPDGSADYAQRLWTMDGKVAKEIDAAGNTTRFAYDERRNLVAVYSPTGAVTRYDYDLDNNPIRITDPAGKAWQRQYDGKGNLTAQTDPAGRLTRYAYDAQGQLTGVTDARGGSTTLAYNEAGQLVATTDCSGKTTRFSYNPLGHLIAGTDAAKHVTHYAADALGRVTTVTRADGSKEHIEYDAEDRPVRMTDANGKTTRYGYNPQGLLTERLDANGHRLMYRYNGALQLIQLINQNGEHTDFAYDAAGNLIKETGFDGKTTRYLHDSAGHLVESVSGPVRTEYERDGVGQLLAKHVHVATPGGPIRLVTRYRHDALGRLSAVTSRDGSVHYRYDDAGHLIGEEQHVAIRIGERKIERVFTLQHEVDELGNRIGTVLPNGRRLGVQRYGSGHWIGTLWNGAPLADLERDDLHRETVRQLGRRQERITQTRQYDALSRLTGQRLRHEQERLAGRHFHYDPAGQLARIEDSHRDQIHYAYDPVGQLLKAAQPNLVETFQFDPAGNLTDGTPQRTILHNKAGKDHETWEDGLDYLTDQPRGEARPAIAPVTRNLLKQYLNMTFDYDREGNTARKIVKGNQDEQPYSLTLTYDAENRLVKASRPGPGEVVEAEYRYDAFGRRTAKIVRNLKMAQATGTWGAADRMETVSEDITFFAWDGDVLIQEVQPDKTITYLYEPESFVPLAQVHSDTNDSEYDPQHVQAKREREAQQQASEEDEAEKLKWLKVTDAKAYELAAKSIEDRRQQERRDEFERLAREAKNDRIYFVHTDHLGTPQEVVSEDGEVVWLARYKAWGRVHKLDKEEIRQPLRFQGQYEDAETGLYYNRYRYYDPDTARYLTQDPIGLAGGNNLYGYSPNPTKWVDPLGLTPCPGTPITNNSARKLLKARGLSKVQQHEVVNSFDGQIHASQGHVDEKFIITESAPGMASGVFVTRCSAGATPAERRQKLALPPSNTAEVENPVALARNQVLLEGKVAPQLQWGADKTGGGWQVVTAGGKYTGAIKR